MEFQVTLKKRGDLPNPDKNSILVASLKITSREADRWLPVLKVFSNKKTQTSLSPPLPPLTQGPPNVNDLFTRRDPHFFRFVQEMGPYAQSLLAEDDPTVD